jgi:DNA-binding CsgD family transcriptional regulator
MDPARQSAEPTEEMLAVRVALTLLTRCERRMLELHVEGRSSREVAKSLGVSRSTVCHSRRRAMRKVRAMLTPAENGVTVPGVAFVQAMPYRSIDDAVDFAKRIERDRHHLSLMLAFGVPGVRDLRGTVTIPPIG